MARLLWASPIGSSKVDFFNTIRILPPFAAIAKSQPLRSRYRTEGAEREISLQIYGGLLAHRWPLTKRTQACAYLRRVFARLRYLEIAAVTISRNGVSLICIRAVFWGLWSPLLAPVVR